MFDGNHRSSRKHVDLGGKSRTKRLIGVTNMVEQSRVLRETRRSQQLQQTSAIILQRIWRGRRTRSRIQPHHHQQQQQQQQCGTIKPLALSVFLSTNQTPSQRQRDLLLLFVDTLESPSSVTQNPWTHLTQRRIVRATLQELMLMATADSEDTSNIDVNFSDPDPDAHKLLKLLSYCISMSQDHQTPLSYSEYVQLALTWSAWHHNNHQNATIADTLYEWTISCSTETTIPIMAAARIIRGHLADSNLLSLVETLKSNMETNLVTSVKELLQGKELIILTNALCFYNLISPEDFLFLLDYCLSQRDDLLWALVLSIKEQSIPKFKLLQKHDALNHDDDDDNSSLTDNDDVDMTDTTTTSTSKKQTSSSQVQTIPKLDQLYSSHVQRNLLSSKTSHISTTLVQDLTCSTLWLQIGKFALSDRASDETRHVYCKLLATLLQGCCSHKSSTISYSFLSQLSFDQSLLNNLWRYLLSLIHTNNTNDQQAVPITLFCDVFAQQLISISDSLFLDTYTTLNTNLAIDAEHVIVTLRHILHDLYWQRPVVADDIPSDRARLLLSGTNLWNSLYERWCRLVRLAPFCDESTWWFPRLASRDDDQAVVNSREVRDSGDSSDDLAQSFRDAKMARVLTCIPQALPFDRRVKLFHALLHADKLKTQDETSGFRRALARMVEQGHDILEFNGREQIEIHRGSIYDDSMRQLNQLGSQLKGKVQVTFINQHGAQEAGIDGGGVFKEFLDDLIKEAFDPSNEKLFTITPLQTLAVHMETVDQAEMLQHYEFLGRVLGKAVYESILVEPQFCLPFLNQLLGKQNSLEDLKNLDDEFYSNLVKLRNMSDAEIDTLGLTFELQLGPSRVVPLLPDGLSKPVTKQNVIHYVHLVAHYRLNVLTAPQTRAFLRGFRDLIPASWVRIFSAHELQKLVSGDDTIRGIDVASLKQAMQYAGGYHPSQQVMEWFWEVIDEFTPDQQRKFLKFMTSCSRQPLLGFQSLAPAPCIQQIRLPENSMVATAPLPTSATCMNLLKLPNYKSKELLRKKLIASIESGAGFELT